MTPDKWQRETKKTSALSNHIYNICFTNQPQPPTHPHPLPSPNKKAFHKIPNTLSHRPLQEREREMAMAAMALRNRLSSSSINNSIRPFVNHLVLNLISFPLFFFFLPANISLTFHFRSQSSLASQALQDKEKSRATVSHFLFTCFDQAHFAPL